MRSLGIPVVLASLTLLGAGPAWGQTRPPSSIQRIGTLRGSGIRESSGVAVSRRHTNVYWTHNDSGDEPRVYAVGSDGTLRATFRVPGARAVDWEDIALGPCPWSLTTECLFLGDIGDNGERRTRVIIYIVPEPDLPTEANEEIETAPARAVRIRYRDGPHDAEALVVAPNGTLDIVTKGWTGPILRYSAAAAQLLEDSLALSPREIAEISPQRIIGRVVTGAAMARNGERIVLRTYTELFFFRPDTDGLWVLEGPPCWLGATETQGEGVDFEADGALILTSEVGVRGLGTIHRVRCP